tara:strand:- start:35 stop:280 length:246 start_codon:yes stop_codon:yes gene_type:complete
MSRHKRQFEQMVKHKKETRWITKSEYVNVETGEIISKQRVLNSEFYKLKQTVNYESSNRGKIRNLINECKETGQTNIFGTN